MPGVLAVLLPVALLSAFGGCSLLEEETGVRVMVPDLPAWWIPHRSGISLRLVWIGSEGDEEEILADSWEAREIRIPKLPNVAVLAYPRFRGEELRPAGGLYPATLEGGGGRLRLSWIDGFASELLLAASRAGIPLEMLNGVRFLSTAAERAGGNPWRLDRERPLEALIAGRFSMYDFSLRDGYPANAPVGEGSRFLPADPLAPPVTADGTGFLRFDRLEVGFHRYFEDEPEIPGADAAAAETDAAAGGTPGRVLSIDVRSKREIVVITGG